MAADQLDASSQIQDLINRLRSPIPDLPTLLSLLTAPLDCLSILPPRFHQYKAITLPPDAFRTSRHVPLIQRALLEHVTPAWKPALDEANMMALVDQYFVPDAFMNATPSAGQVSMHAYSTLLSLPFNDYSLSLLTRLSTSYPVDRLYTSIYGTGSSVRAGYLWEDAIRNVLSVPAKVANALEGRNIPPELEQGQYFRNLSIRTEILLYTQSERNIADELSPSVFLLTKLVNVGAFPPSRTLSPSQPTFFGHALDKIRSRLAQPSVNQYSNLWMGLLASCPSLTVQSILHSLFAHFENPTLALDTSPRGRGHIKQVAQALRDMLGDANGFWDSMTAVIIGRTWDDSHARIFSCWAAGAKGGRVDKQNLEKLVNTILDVWTSAEHVKHSLLSKHRYITLLLLCTLTYLPPTSPILKELSFSPPFIQSITYYISHLDQSVRRCGMLVAEEVAHLAGKTLDFKDWDGDDDGKKWAREVRVLLSERDIDFDGTVDGSVPPELDVIELVDEIVESRESKPAVVATEYDSDDSLTGYADVSSSRSPSPTMEELAEIERDPTLNVGQKKIPRPVYLAQLGELIRSTSGTQSGEDMQEADKISVALNIAEELIRRKCDYGTELEENSVNLVYGLVGLKDNFDLEGFDRKRQAALIALVACSPTRAAPAIIEEFFKNQYSMDQRFAMLNALALGARELAGLPMPDDAPLKPLTGRRIDFPSKRLPPALHERYNQDPTSRVQGMLEGITRLSIAGTRDAAEDRIPAAARERQLRIRQPTKVAEVQHRSIPSTTTTPISRPTFTTLGVEHFLYPLMNRFWLFLRDEQVREARTAAREPLHRYRGTGTALVLSSPVLAHFLATLAVLVHAARTAPAWRAVVAPDALELAVTLGTRPLSRADPDDDTEGDDLEARVLAVALELALVVLEGSVELDDGRVLALEHTGLLVATSEWAQTVFEALDKGLRVRGGGGAAEVRLSKAVASVVLKADEISQKWRRSMIVM
ncbi:telomere length regulation protein-domain-containing protein [Vararia minispora EC-137]|uniref:Telomere length regulation protein-domain-containing protein n=1 Tax=Vararia minispora EC-137 TaxID=1314806 RepID=A0ACB8QWN5_9AGAM|nr:telomere length regulation protein-domain-containing protein [Vararia minispora EC-137]